MKKVILSLLMFCVAIFASFLANAQFVQEKSISENEAKISDKVGTPLEQQISDQYKQASDEQDIEEHLSEEPNLTHKDNITITYQDSIDDTIKDAYEDTINEQHSIKSEYEGEVKMAFSQHIDQ